MQHKAASLWAIAHRHIGAARCSAISRCLLVAHVAAQLNHLVFLFLSQSPHIRDAPENMELVNRTDLGCLEFAGQRGARLLLWAGNLAVELVVDELLSQPFNELMCR